MIELRLLGALGLESADGPITGRAAQKRRLALLAVLALAPGRTLGRDKLIAALWPDAHDEQARHLLSVALHELRKALGEDALVSRGDDVQLGGGVRTDLDRFDEAVRAGDAATALAVLRGPLLDGFHLPDVPELEHWLDGERERVARHCAAGLEELAVRRAAEGDALGAVEVWRRRAALDPYNGRVALALMRALEAAGDRAGALQHARVHTLLLREEYGTAPDPEVEAFAEQLRAAPARARVAAPQSTPAGLPAAAAPDAAPAVPSDRPPPVRAPTRRLARLRGRLAGMQALTALALVLSLVAIAYGVFNRESDPEMVSAAETASIAVLPFRGADAGSADERGVSEGESLGVMLGHSLERAGLRVAPVASVMRLAGNTDLRAAGAALNVEHLLEGTFASEGEDMRVTVRLVRARTGQVTWQETFRRRGAFEDMVRLQEDIARLVVRALNVPAAGGDAPPVLAPPDERAWTEFIAGVDAMVRRTAPELGAALGHFQRAVELDSTFARAHAAVAEVYTLLGAYDYGVLPPDQAYEAARLAARRALRHDPLLAEAHAALAVVNFNYEWDWASAERSFEEAMRLNRGFPSARQWYSLLLSARGRHEEALNAARLARQLEPSSLVFRAALARSHYYARNYERAITEFAAAVAEDSTFLTAHLGLGLAYVVNGQVAEAIDHYEAARALPAGGAPVLAGLLGHAYGLAGRTADARRELARIQAAGERSYVPAEYRVLVHLGLGEHDRALDALEEAYRNRSGGIAYLGADPILDPLREQPRFKDLLRRARI